MWKNTLTVTPVIFNWKTVHPMAQLSWHIKTAITAAHVHGDWSVRSHRDIVHAVYRAAKISGERVRPFQVAGNRLVWQAMLWWLSTLTTVPADRHPHTLTKVQNPGLPRALRPCVASSARNLKHGTASVVDSLPKSWSPWEGFRLVRYSQGPESHKCLWDVD